MQFNIMNSLKVHYFHYIFFLKCSQVYYIYINYIGFYWPACVDPGIQKFFASKWRREGGGRGGSRDNFVSCRDEGGSDSLNPIFDTFTM